jgi:hypothetical protein
MKRLATIAVLVGCAVQPVRAQWHVDAGLAGTRETVQLRGGTSAARMTGTVLGGEALVTRGQFTVRLRYAQGRVANDSARRDLALGDASLGYAPLSWVEILVGPQARTFIATGISDRRWLFWTGRVRVRGAIFPERLASVVEVWQGLSGRLNRPAAAASGGGVELGIEARVPRKPLTGRLSYRIEQGRASGGIKETVEGFTLTIAFSRYSVR